MSKEPTYSKIDNIIINKSLRENKSISWYIWSSEDNGDSNLHSGNSPTIEDALRDTLKGLRDLKRLERKT